MLIIPRKLVCFAFIGNWVWFNKNRFNLFLPKSQKFIKQVPIQTLKNNLLGLIKKKNYSKVPTDRPIIFCKLFTLMFIIGIGNYFKTMVDVTRVRRRKIILGSKNIETSVIKIMSHWLNSSCSLVSIMDPHLVILSQ